MITQKKKCRRKIGSLLLIITLCLTQYLPLMGWDYEDTTENENLIQIDLPVTHNLTETIGENSLETNGVLSLPPTKVYDHYADNQIVEHGSTPETADSNSTHPITKDEFQFIDLEEFVVLPYKIGLDPIVYGDAGNDFNETHSIPEDLDRYLDGYDDDYQKGICYDLALGDIDGDGYDEIIMVDLGDLLIIYDDYAHDYALMGKYSIRDTAPYQSITTGDVDGDGIDEILHTIYQIGASAGDLGIGCSVYLSVYKFVPTWECIAYRTVVYGYNLPGTEKFGMEPEIATGDFDGDGRDEIAVAFTFDNSNMSYDDIWILDDYQNDFVRIWSSYIFEYLSDNDLYPTMDIDITTGDFDGDGLDEIAYSASVLITGTGYRAKLAIIDNDFTFELFDIITNPSDIFIYKTPVAAGDLDGDGRDEIVMGTAYANMAGSGDIHIFEYLPEDDSYELNTSISASFLDTWLDVGDVDCDGLDEIVGSGRYHTGVIDDGKHSYAVMGSNTDVGGVVRIGDLDGDGVRLQYTGESWNNTPSPGVVAVIASPPVYDGIDQNYISSYTAFGQETSIGSGVGSELGTIVSTTYSFDQTFDWGMIELLRVSAERAVNTEFIKTNTKTHTEIKTVSYATGWTDDAVIFHVTSYTSYKYQIIHHPYNSSIVGSHMTIDVPDAPLINTWTVPYFNSVQGELETLNHTIGQPWTYPSRAESAMMAPIRWAAGEQVVGQGSGFTTTTIEVAEQTVHGMEMVITSDEGGGGAIAGFGFDRSTGTADSSIYEIIIGESAIFEGCVGFIADEEMWEELNYIYNLIAYNQNTPDGRSYLVINYYVEGASIFVPTTAETTSGESSERFISAGTGILGFLVIITLIRVVKRKRNLIK